MPSLWSMKPCISSESMFTVQALYTRPFQSNCRGHPGMAAGITVLTGRSGPPSMVSRLTQVLINNWTDWDLSWCTAQINLWWKRGMLWRHIKSVSCTAWNGSIRNTLACVSPVASEQTRDQCLAQRHFSTLIAGVRNQTTNLPFSGQPLVLEQKVKIVTVKQMAEILTIQVIVLNILAWLV